MFCTTQRSLHNQLKKTQRLSGLSLCRSPFLLLCGNLIHKLPYMYNVDASYQVSIHLARQFQRRRFFRYQPIRNNNCLWWSCLLTDRDEMSNLHRGHSIDTSCHVLVNLAKRFQRRRFKKIGQSETRIACPGPYLVMDHNKMCTLQRGFSIDASYQVSVHLADEFQRRRLKCEKLTDDRQQKNIKM